MGFDEESEVWKPYASPGARENLLRTLAATASELSLEGRDAEAIFIAREFAEPNLSVQMLVSGPIPFRPGEQLTIRFGHEGEKYFFRCVPAFAGSGATLNASELFQLQRRKHFRIPIPQGFPSRIEIDVQHAQRPVLHGTVLNINAFGIGFDVPSGEKFEVGELVHTEVQLGERKSAKVGGHVRHIREANGRTQVGMQFDHSIYQSQDAVQTILGFFRHDSFYFNKK